MEINFLAFLITTLTISLTPGMAMFYCLHSSLRAGRRAGLTAALGVELGTLVYVLVTVLGLSSLITAAPPLYGALKIVGSLYLCYLAYTSFPRRTKKEISAIQDKTIPNGNKLLSGFLLNVMNPKILIFFLTLLPQFVPVESRDGRTFLLLGLLFNLSGLIVNAAVAYFSPHLSKFFKTESPVLTALQYIPPLVFVGTAVYGVSDLFKL